MRFPQLHAVNTVAYPHGGISFQVNKLNHTLLLLLHAQGNLKVETYGTLKSFPRALKKILTATLLVKTNL